MTATLSSTDLPDLQREGIADKLLNAYHTPLLRQNDPLLSCAEIGLWRYALSVNLTPLVMYVGIVGHSFSLFMYSGCVLV